jgi:hypothetical protein
MQPITNPSVRLKHEKVNCSRTRSFSSSGEYNHNKGSDGDICLPYRPKPKLPSHSATDTCTHAEYPETRRLLTDMPLFVQTLNGTRPWMTERFLAYTNALAGKPASRTRVQGRPDAMTSACPPSWSGRYAQPGRSARECALDVRLRSIPRSFRWAENSSLTTPAQPSPKSPLRTLERSAPLRTSSSCRRRPDARLKWVCRRSRGYEVRRGRRYCAYRNEASPSRVRLTRYGCRCSDICAASRPCMSPAQTNPRARACCESSLSPSIFRPLRRPQGRLPSSRPNPIC